MAILAAQLEVIKRHLSGMETSQRVALGLCVVLIALAFLMLSQLVQQREMVPLYAEAMSEDELSGVVSQLQVMGEQFQERNNTVYVRSEDLRRLIMVLNERSSGPTDLSITFSTLLKDKDHFASAQKTRFNQNVALMNELALTIQAWPRVKEARVLIAPQGAVRRLNQPSPPKATVQVRLVGNRQLDRGVVDSLARIVSGAVPGLEPRNVSVVDIVAGRSYTVDDTEDQFGTMLYELQRQKERELLAKIEDLLSHIPGVKAQVTLKLDPQTVSRVDTELGEPAVEREVREETNSSTATGPQEPGLSANSGVALAGGGGGQNSLREKTETEYMRDRGGSVTQTDKKPGTIVRAAAAIGVPHSYFVGAFKAVSGDPGAEPTPDQLSSFLESQRAEIANQVKPILDAVTEGECTVAVSVFSDGALAYIAPPPEIEQEQAGAVTQFVAANVKLLGLAALALLAMGMALMVVRRGAEHTVVPGESERTGPSVGPLGELTIDGGPVGKAGSPDAFLIAQETDENSIRARQISQQVSDLINDDPEGAAQLVRRWIEREP